MNYITILDFMVDELDLKGNELIVYALIYGFSQDGTSDFHGSINYIMQRTNIKGRSTTIEILQKLIEKGLIVKTGESGMTNHYTTTKERKEPKQHASAMNKRKETYKSIIDGYSSNEEINTALTNYVEYRKKGKSGYTINSLKMNLKALDNLKANDQDKVMIINQSIEHCWKSFYPLKNQNRKIVQTWEQPIADTNEQERLKLIEELQSMNG